VPYVESGREFRAINAYFGGASAAVDYLRRVGSDRSADAYAGRVPATVSRRVVVALVAATMMLPVAASAFPPAPPSAQQTQVRLERLTVAAAGTLAGYSRERFGGDWASTGTAGCDVRERVLIRDGRGVTPGPGCRITTGRWRSVYDGKIVTAGRGVDIDHVVPLAEAWRSGADAWTAQRRERFANDLREPQLIAVSASSNRSKGDSPPQEWKPPRRAIWCLYSRWWTDVKATYRLTVTVAEKRALRVMLRTCD